LKTLEEPVLNTVLILLTSAPQEILPTIASRCSIVRFQPLGMSEIASLLKAKGLSESLALLAHGSAGKAFDLAAREPIEKALFSLLSDRVSYPELSLKLAALEEGIEDEDPVKKNLNVEHIFSTILMWHRDRVAKHFGAALFFPDAPEAKGPLPNLETIEKAVDEARLAVSRNMRLSTCLERIFAVT